MNQSERENTGALSSIIKLYLIRGAFCLLLFGICGIPIALAQWQPEGGNLDVVLANPPIVTTNAATNVASTSAILNGTVNPNGLATNVYFEYGTTTNYGSTTSSHSYSGTTTQNVSANITGLSAHTTYHFRIVASNSSGTSYGSDRTFTTFNATGAPAVTTNPATNIASFSATLNGSVYPHGLTTTVYFQYGTTTSYGHTTASQIKTGNTYQSVSASILGLNASTTYHFRLVATNTAGTTYGNDRTFTTLSATGAPVVTTNPASFIASFSATLNASLDPHGLTTTVYFQYGTTTSYGLTTPMQSQTGNTYRNITANISSLSAGTTYHFRIVAMNSAGTRYGSDRTFTTLSASGPPVITTNPATNIASLSATLNGSLDPHGLTTSVYFQYGMTTSYGHTTPMHSHTGNTFRNISAPISGLSAQTTYHFRIVASNSAGARYGSDRTFSTPPIVVTVTSASDDVDGDTSSVQALIANPGPDGTISLREALQAANNTGGTNPITITFASALAGQSIFPLHTMSIQRDGITLQGFLDNTHQPVVTIDGSQFTDSQALLNDAGSSNFAVRFLRFVNIQGSAGFAFIGISPTPNHPQIGNITIQGNVFSNPPGLTRYATGVAAAANFGTGTVLSNVTIADNTFTDFEAMSNGIGAGVGGTNNTLQDTLIVGNTFSDVNVGIEFGVGNANNSRILRTRVVGNSFVNSLASALMGAGDGTVGQPPTTGNVIDDTIFDSNRFIDNGDKAIFMGGGTTNASGNTISNTRIVNNLIAGTTSQQGILVVGGFPGGTYNMIEGVAIVNNTIANNVGIYYAIGVIPNAGNPPAIGNTVSGVSVSNTILWGNTPNSDFFGVDPSQVQYSITAQNGYFGINHNINADPLFVNPATNDFHLQAGSPALHAGTSGAPGYDLDCQPRGFPPSMGAYEFDGPNICTW